MLSGAWVGGFRCDAAIHSRRIAAHCRGIIPVRHGHYGFVGAGGFGFVGGFVGGFVVGVGFVVGGTVGLVVGFVVGGGVVGFIGFDGFAGLVGLFGLVVGLIGLVGGFVGGFADESVRGVIGFEVVSLVSRGVIVESRRVESRFIIEESRIIVESCFIIEESCFIIDESRIIEESRIIVESRIMESRIRFCCIAAPVLSFIIRPRRARRGLAESLDDPLTPPALMLPPPERAAARVGAGMPFSKPMFMAASMDLASVAPLYFASHFLTAARVVASRRPVTWATPQPSSRSCCCNPITSTRVSPCANAGAAQQKATVQAPSKRYFIICLQRGVMRLNAQPPPGSKRRAQTLFEYYLGDNGANAEKRDGSSDYRRRSHPD